MTTNVFSLFSVPRMRRLAKRDRFIRHVLKDRWDSPAHVEAQFNTEVAGNPAMLRSYCEANELPVPYNFVLQCGEELHGADSVEQAASFWETIRKQRDLGSRDTPRLLVIDTHGGVTVAELSYNARLWMPDHVGEIPFNPEASYANRC